MHIAVFCSLVPAPVWRRHDELAAVAHNSVVAVLRARDSVTARGLAQRQARLRGVCRCGGDGPGGCCSGCKGGLLAVVPPIQLFDELFCNITMQNTVGKELDATAMCYDAIVCFESATAHE